MSFNYNEEEPNLFQEEKKDEPEVCLGKTFESTEERREYYRNLLREKLKDPEFKIGRASCRERV